MCEKGFVLSLHVSPNSRGFGLAGFDEPASKLKLKTRAPARRGAANREIEREMERMFNSKVKIVSGFSSRNKQLLIPGLTKKEAVQILNKAHAR